MISKLDQKHTYHSGNSVTTLIQINSFYPTHDLLSFKTLQITCENPKEAYECSVCFRVTFL